MVCLQVLCNGGIPTLIALGYGILVGCIDVPLGPSPHSEVWRAKLATLLEGAFLGYYAACCGDTWASELGPLSTDTPRLITTLRPVRKGTNGGVTWLGLAASALGGAFVGAIFYASALVSPTLLVLEGQQGVAVRQWLLILMGLAAGLTGSLIDSVLGATLQVSYVAFVTSLYITGIATCHCAYQDTVLFMACYSAVKSSKDCDTVAVEGCTYLQQYVMWHCKIQLSQLAAYLLMWP
jgi:uncharacterized membrane protein